jgi:serine/threonine protein kinase
MKLTKEDTLTIPPQYLPISVAGNGIQGSVYFCLPRSSIPLTRSLSKASLTALKKQIVAVKISYKTSPFAAEAAAQEVAVLKKISTLVPADLKSQFTTLVDAELAVDSKGVEICNWIALRALTPVVTLGAFKLEILPPCKSSQALAAHFFLQMGAALRFLHNDAEIAHRDLHDHNILIDTASPSPNGLPNFVILDFGEAVVASERAVRGDVALLCHEVYNLMCLAEPQQNEEWAEFRFVLREVEFGERIGLEELWERIAGLAREVVGKVTEEEVEDVRGVIRGVVRDTENSVTVMDLRDALESM